MTKCIIRYCVVQTCSGDLILIVQQYELYSYSYKEDVDVASDCMMGETSMVMAMC